eukprot:CAMPEP_0119342018 /NCGR_PEP_ID=MMETSP1333-20130426/103820_1 /TAXON_ID=418940 /ORGANISM="Scyphosphaera apsteinii, Strain RCC1455" /LENGTH=56 /DNA_ID=CAMNT_0007354143 /DNA_START=227 /DNA_END=394 /DNA_ORIENTATION=-
MTATIWDCCCDIAAAWTSTASDLGRGALCPERAALGQHPSPLGLQRPLFQKNRQHL